MQDIPGEAGQREEFEPREEISSEELISAAVAEAKRHVRRNELKTNSALDAISEWIEKSEIRRSDETKRLATSQERVASAVRDALGVVTNRLNHIEGLVTEAPARAFEPIRSALGRLDERVSSMEAAQGADQRNSEHFVSMMDSLGKRLSDVVGKIDELAEARNRDDPALREERIAGIEAKLGSILRQLSRPATMAKSDFIAATPPSPAASAPAARPRVILRTVASSGKLDAAIGDIRHRQSELGDPPGAMAEGRASTDAALGITSLRAELGALAIQLQHLEKGRGDADTLDELLSTTSEVRRLLVDPAMPRLAARLEQGVGDLTRRVDALTRKAVDRGEILALTAAISEIRAKLAQPLQGIDPAGVERRIEALSAKIDDVMREPLGLVGQHLADLSARLGTSRETVGPQDTILEIRDKLDRIVERVDIPSINAGASNENVALGEVRDRLDQLARRLDHESPSVEASAMADLRDRFDRLATSIEQSSVNAPEKIDRVLRQIAANMNMTRQLDPHPSAFQGLERQIAALGERLDSGQSAAGALGDLERSVTRLFAELADTKAAAIKAAETAASGASYQATETALALRSERSASERDMHSALGQMNTTLERMMDHLSSLEDRTLSPAEPFRASDVPMATPEVDEASDAIESFEAAPPGMPRPPAAVTQARHVQIAEKPVAVSHEPLEPGSGRPTPTAVPIRAAQGPAAAPRDASAPASIDLGAPAASSGAMSAQALIAAARRAAADASARQKSATTSASSPLGSAKGALSTLRASAGTHKKPILLALIGLMVAFSAIGAGRLIMGEAPGLDQGGPPAATPSSPSRGVPGIDGGPAKPATPAPANGPAPGKQGGDPAPPTGNRSSSLPAPVAPAFTRVGQTAIAGAPADPSRPANEVVVGSIASPAASGSATSPPKQEPTAPTPAATPDPASSPNFIAKLKLAANSNDPIAEYELAARMYDGRGVARDQQGAAKLFERAANQGLAPAQYRIANIYETGIGAQKDLALAKAWFEKAADRGNAKAMHNVGVYLAQGIQGKPDYPTAVTWFRKAAERNVRDSQFNLAILLARGLGVARDFKAAYVWFALAARDGDADSAKKRDEIAAHLVSADLDDAKAAVAQWKPIEVDRAANEVDVSDIKWDRVSPAATQADPPKTSKL